MKKEVKILSHRKKYYSNVTLYDYDHPRKKVLLTTNDFYEATRFIQERQSFIAYLDDMPNEHHQRWGLRKCR